MVVKTRLDHGLLVICPKHLTFMRKLLILVISASFLLTSCSLFRSNKHGCPSTNGNIGAERIMSGDPKAAKDLKKGKKYRAGKF